MGETLFLQYKAQGHIQYVREVDSLLNRILQEMQRA